MQRATHFKFPGTENPKACLKNTKEAKSADSVKHPGIFYNSKTNETFKLGFSQFCGFEQI